MIGRSPLLQPGWRYIETVALEAFSPAEWQLLNAQRREYMAADQARQVLRLLDASAEDATFGYLVNNFRHCLQSATLALRDGRDEETVVVCLLHDIGFITCPSTHGEFAAALLGPSVSEATEWMLRHHQVFQDFHLHADPDVDRHARERWRGHPHFEWTATFVERYDQAANDPGYDCAPLATFEPMVRRVFARPPRRGSRTDEAPA
jgi:predicted HD phosphohydrolase